MYRVNNYGDIDEFETVEETAQYIIDNLDGDDYDEMLDEVYGEVDICGYSYSASYALRNLDPTAYRCGMNDYYDSLYSDVVDILEGIWDGDTDEIYGFEVEYTECEEEEEEEEEE